MTLEITIIILAFSFLIIFHELGHFFVAKKFGVKVEEFGLGLPPRIFGKKIGETIFSLNYIPFGGFVRLEGEEGAKGPRSFSGKPIWQRSLIIVAGVVANWLIAIVLLSIVFNMGVSARIGDDEIGLENIRVQIMEVTDDSPAEIAGLRVGDRIKGALINGEKREVMKVREVQEFIGLHPEKEVSLIIGRIGYDDSKVINVKPVLLEEKGVIGIELARIAKMDGLPWNQALTQGIIMTGNFTVLIIEKTGELLTQVVRREPLPEGVEFAGPIGIFSFMRQKFQMGTVYFLKFIAIISIHLAIINILPIPALDGGKLLFMGIEKIKGFPVNLKIENALASVSFFLLIGLIIFITIRFDIPRLFQ